MPDAWKSFNWLTITASCNVNISLNWINKNRHAVWFQYIEISICFISDSASRISVYGNTGDNITLPCHLDGQSPLFGNRIKWTKLEDDDTETDVIISMGFHKKTYGDFQDRAYLTEVDENDATLVITDLDVKDYGTYRCEIINGMHDKIIEVNLEVQGSFSLSCMMLHVILSKWFLFI